MKRKLAALLAASLLLTLAACQETPEVPAEPEKPAVVEPEQPPKPAQPEKPAEPAPEDPPEEPIEPPEEEDPPEDPSPEQILSHTDEAETFPNESGEELVSLYPTNLSVHTGNETADSVINAYYENVFGKLRDLCTGEVMELSEEMGWHYSVTAEATLARYNDDLISIARTVTVLGEESGLRTVTRYGETFDRHTGGLLTADDFFAVDEETYLERLSDCVCQAISEDPYHDQIYFAQWEEQARRALRKENFYVTDEAYVVFYQENDLGAESAEFAIPWSRLEDIAA